MKEGWEYKKLGEVCDFEGGSQPPKSEWINHSQEGYVRMLQIRDFTKSRNFEIEYVKITKKLRLCKADDILIGRYGASVGKILTGLAGAYNVAIIKSIPDEKVIVKSYIRRYFESSLFQGILFKVCASRAAQAGFSKEDICDALIPVPPLSEQKSIVDYLDSAFAKIYAMKANAEKALNEAKALFQASLKEMLEPKEGWEEKKMGDICEIIRGKRFVRADIVEDGVPCIHYGDIYTHYGLSIIKTRGYVKPELAKKLRFAKKNDVVVVQAGENNWDIGVGVAYFGEEPAVVHDACFILRHTQDPMYISYYLRSYNYHRYLVDYVHEGKICSFLKPALENAPFPLPPLSEQQTIVATLDSLKSKVDRLQENYNKVSQECDALKQAILRQVFE
ncbi:type I restriction enzyme, S subunit [Prevotellaceae bacterium HUN156]|nr:type I restriction enzyme, S subunit [Prevotellaceae bacterium HUN156]